MIGGEVMDEKNNCRILVVDDHPIVREGIIRLIATCSSMQVCGDTGDGHAVMAMIASLRPSAVVLDLTLDGADGLSLLGEIHTRYPRLPVLVLSMHNESTHALRSIRAGARGYLMKKSASREILGALTTVLEGKLYVSETVKYQMIDSFAGRQSGSGSSVDRLSQREFQIFRLVGQGFQTTSIAEKLHCSPKTVETHVLRIRNKLQLRNINELTALAGAYQGAEYYL